MKKALKLSMFSALLLVTACGGDVREELGMTRNAPDEFAVEKRPRLDMPPQFKLRPPAPGEQPLNISDTRDEARKKLINAPLVEGAQSSGESNLLNKMGTSKSEGNIREVIRQEYDEQADPGILQRIRSISDNNVNKTLVDPKKEKARIQSNKENNKPITEGETPAKSMNDGKTVIQKIFN